MNLHIMMTGITDSIIIKNNVTCINGVFNLIVITFVIVIIIIIIKTIYINPNYVNGNLFLSTLSSLRYNIITLWRFAKKDSSWQ